MRHGPRNVPPEFPAQLMWGGPVQFARRSPAARTPGQAAQAEEDFFSQPPSDDARERKVLPGFGLYLIITRRKEGDREQLAVQSESEKILFVKIQNLCCNQIKSTLHLLSKL